MNPSLDALSALGHELANEQLDQTAGGLFPLLLGYGLTCAGIGFVVGYVWAQ